MTMTGRKTKNKTLDAETRKMILDPLGYDPIKDIDEIHNRNRRNTDVPQTNLTVGD
jgi:hypothetical protein